MPAPPLRTLVLSWLAVGVTSYPFSRVVPMVRVWPGMTQPISGSVPASLLVWPGRERLAMRRTGVALLLSDRKRSSMLVGVVRGSTGVQLPMAHFSSVMVRATLSRHWPVLMVSLSPMDLVRSLSRSMLSRLVLPLLLRQTLVWSWLLMVCG